jgi:hypothetical protein
MGGGTGFIDLNVNKARSLSGSCRTGGSNGGELYLKTKDLR